MNQFLNPHQHHNYFTNMSYKDSIFLMQFQPKLSDKDVHIVCTNTHPLHHKYTSNNLIQDFLCIILLYLNQYQDKFQNYNNNHLLDKYCFYILNKYLHLNNQRNSISLKYFNTLSLTLLKRHFNKRDIYCHWLLPHFL